MLAINDFNLDIAKNEFIALIGPSGCGKSTLLRMIAGLEEITYGSLIIDDKLTNSVHAKDRNMAMVFQNYALYPHLTNFNNIAFGLKLKKISKKELEHQVHAVAEMLGLTPYLAKYPSELSGGQRQRVALGRAIVQVACIFLMDEPLSNLDAKLRNRMRVEILRLHKQLNMTTIYVTHDQVEAMTMADRIVVLKDGVIQQIGTPHDLYYNPHNLFVARFIGEPEINCLQGSIINSKLHLMQHVIPLVVNLYPRLAEYEGKAVIVALRAEDFIIDGDITTSNVINGKIELVEMRGDHYILMVRLGEEVVSIKRSANIDYKLGDLVIFSLRAEKIILFAVDSGERI